MNLLYALPFLSLIVLNSGDTLSAEIEYRIQQACAGDCCNDITNCHARFDADRDWTATSIQLVGFGEEPDKGCCYNYFLQHPDPSRTDAKRSDCSDAGSKPRALSHLDLDIYCDGLNPYVTWSNPNTASYGYDGSTCFNSLKFDTGLEDASAFFKVCLKWDGFVEGGGCATKEGWYMMKSQTFDFEAIQVPTCTQPQEGPTCEQQGLGLEPTAHTCQCVDALECPADGAYCNTIGFVANRLQGGNFVTDDCEEGSTCCCWCSNCAPLE